MQTVMWSGAGSANKQSFQFLFFFFFLDTLHQSQRCSSNGQSGVSGSKMEVKRPFETQRSDERVDTVPKLLIGYAEGPFQVGQVE